MFECRQVFRALRGVLPADHCGGPAHWLLDFERAAWNAAKSVFPECVPEGCFFHFRKAIHRQVQEIAVAVSGGSPAETHVPIGACVHLGL